MLQLQAGVKRQSYVFSLSPYSIVCHEFHFHFLVGAVLQLFIWITAGVRLTLFHWHFRHIGSSVIIELTFLWVTYVPYFLYYGVFVCSHLTLQHQCIVSCLADQIGMYSTSIWKFVFSWHWRHEWRYSVEYSEVCCNYAVDRAIAFVYLWLCCKSYSLYADLLTIYLTLHPLLFYFIILPIFLTFKQPVWYQSHRYLEAYVFWPLLYSFIYTVHIICRLQNRVCVMERCPSICPSTSSQQQTCYCRFAAVSLAGRRY